MTVGRAARRRYDRIYRRDPIAANVWLLLAELANSRGEVHLGHDAEGEISVLMGQRFPRADGYYPPADKPVTRWRTAKRRHRG